MYSFVRKKISLVIILRSIICFLCDHRKIFFPFETINNRIVITATINGIEGRYMLDTGVDVSSINVSLAGFPVVSMGNIINLGVIER